MDSILNLNLNKNVGRTERIISAIAGSLLMFHGLRKGRKLSEVPLGSFLLFRGATGYCPVKEKIVGQNGIHTIQESKAAVLPQRIHIDTSVTINKPKSEVYAFWRKLENLPLFMKHLESVTVIDTKNSLWSAKIPGGLGTIDWESEITNDQVNENISWRSLPESEIRNSGVVHFKDAGPGKTELHATISYEAPGGIIGEKVGKLLNPVFEKLVKSDIENFKKYLESK
jgi:uncharacterized membrane protein